jgi:hypothetical protein
LIERMIKRIFYVVVAATAIGAFSCNSEGSKGTKNTDTLFLGMSLGMGKQEFYDYCWKMNKEKKFTHGPQNKEVEYVLIDESLRRPVMMRFYPNFHEEKIYEMPVVFSYDAWAPWNREFQSDSLMVEMLDVFKRWYGTEFKVIQHPTQGDVYVRRDDNRRINLFIRDDQFVQAVFTDVKVEKRIIDGQKAQGD